MDTEVPVRPNRVSRDQARQEKERLRLFSDALRAAAKGSGWKLSDGGLFRTEGDWFVSVLPSLLWQRGVSAMSLAKPMAIDPLFWRIVGIPDNERLPLSFRANGAWVLRPPFRQAYVALCASDPAALAHASVTWATDQLTEVKALSLEAQLEEVVSLGDLRKNFAAFEICLRLLMGDWVGAFALSSNHAPHESGGFQTGDKTFFDQAHEWIETHRPH